jgi:hypothetical protein
VTAAEGRRAQWRDRWSRPTLICLTIVVGALGIYVAVRRAGVFLKLGVLGVDHAMFMDFGRRWLEGGTIYLPYQLTGPYAYDVGSGTMDVATMPALYPPIVGPVFAIWRLLPAALWWAIPIAILAYAFVRWRPALWAWPLMLAALIWPNTADSLWAGSSNLWIVAGVAGGLIWGWPAAVIAFKPSFAPFILIGVRRRSWWIAVALVAVLSLAMLSEWLRYVTVIQNLESPGAVYSLGDLPLLLVPVIAWAARRRPADLVRRVDPLGEALASGSEDLRRDGLDRVGDEGVAQR